jgi:hypothetical protein
MKVAAAYSVKATQMQNLLTCVMLQIHCVSPAYCFHSSSITDQKTNEQVDR